MSEGRVLGVGAGAALDTDGEPKSLWKRLQRKDFNKLQVSERTTCNSLSRGELWFLWFTYNLNRRVPRVPAAALIRTKVQTLRIRNVRPPALLGGMTTLLPALR